MDYTRLPIKTQLVKIVEPARELIFHLSRLSNFIFDFEELYKDQLVRRCLSDAIYYAVLAKLTRNKVYPMTQDPTQEFFVCCAYILELKEYDYTSELMEDTALEELLEVIQEHFSYLVVGDKYDIWNVEVLNRTVIRITYRGDYRIELFHFLKMNVEELEERLVIDIDDHHTLLKEFARRNRAIMEERNRTERGPRLSF